MSDIVTSFFLGISMETLRLRTQTRGGPANCGTGQSGNRAGISARQNAALDKPVHWARHNQRWRNLCENCNAPLDRSITLKSILNCKDEDCCGRATICGCRWGFAGRVSPLVAGERGGRRGDAADAWPTQARKHRELLPDSASSGCAEGRNGTSAAGPIKAIHRQAASISETEFRGCKLDYGCQT